MLIISASHIHIPQELPSQIHQAIYLHCVAEIQCDSLACVL